MSAPSTQSFTIENETDVAALAEKFGTDLSLTPDQKACLEAGGTVTLSFTVQQPIAQAPTQMLSDGIIMMNPKEAEEFKKTNGGTLMMTPEQAAAWSKAHCSE